MQSDIIWLDMLFFPTGQYTLYYQLFQQLAQMLIILGCMAVVGILSFFYCSSCCPMSGKPSCMIFQTYGQQQPFCAHMAQVFRPFLQSSCQISLSYTVRLFKVISLLEFFFHFFHQFARMIGCKMEINEHYTNLSRDSLTLCNLVSPTAIV